MIVDFFNFWYFAGIILSVASYFGLYFMLKNRSDEIKKWTLFGLLSFGVLLHFLKALFPPYSVNETRLYNDMWLINICAANIFVFPIIFLTKNKAAKDYMFFLGLFSGIIATVYPIEPILKGDQQIAEIFDVIRFYIHHGILWIVPMLMVTLKMHKVSYKSCIWGPTGLLFLMLFILLNQLFQVELGFIVAQSDNFLEIKYKNSSYIWGPGTNDEIGNFLASFCPDIFKTVPVGEYAGEVKYWPWFWLIFPAYLLLTPLCFGVALIFDWQNFNNDFNKLLNFIHLKI